VCTIQYNTIQYSQYFPSFMLFPSHAKMKRRGCCSYLLFVSIAFTISLSLFASRTFAFTTNTSARIRIHTSLSTRICIHIRSTPRPLTLENSNIRNHAMLLQMQSSKEHFSLDANNQLVNHDFFGAKLEDVSTGADGNGNGNGDDRSDGNGDSDGDGDGKGDSDGDGKGGDNGSKDGNGGGDESDKKDGRGDGSSGGGGNGDNGGNGNGGDKRPGDFSSGEDDESHAYFGALSLLFAQNAEEETKRKAAHHIGRSALASFSSLATKNSALFSAKAKSKHMLQWYISQLESNPLMTKSLTSAMIAMSGDCAAQRLEHKFMNKGVSSGTGTGSAKSYNVRRGMSVFTDGLLVTGPIMHLSYGLFERILPIQTGAGGGGNLAALTHVLADSVFIDAIFVAITMTTTGLFEGYNLRNEIIPQLQTDFVPTMKASWVTSIGLLPLEFASFRYLPLSFRTLAMNLTSLVWDAVISMNTHRSRTQ
jgi:hypothetical protein